MMTPGYTLPRFVRELRAIAASTADPREITRRVRPLARGLALSRSWLAPQHTVADEQQGFGIHVLHEEPDHSLLVFAAAWFPHRGVAPHNHGTWAVVAGVAGHETNVFWKRIDDRSRSGYAKLSKIGETLVGPGDVLMMLPDTIHSVTNQTADVTVSLHVYGFNINLTQRSQFDPDRDVDESVTLKMTPAVQGER
jgi:Predicted metal-dependent enzyme of the double-stranded beta helix superfamily